MGQSELSLQVCPHLIDDCLFEANVVDLVLDITGRQIVKIDLILEPFPLNFLQRISSDFPSLVATRAQFKLLQISPTGLLGVLALGTHDRTPGILSRNFHLAVRARVLF